MSEKIDRWPKGHAKIFNFFQHIIRKEEFLSDVQRVRKQFRIPSEGLDFDPELLQGSFSFPSHLKLTVSQKENFLALMTWLAEKNRMGVMENFKIPLAYFVLYDTVVLPEYYDLCAIQNMRSDKDEPVRRYGEILYSDKTHPIALRISPNASQRDILDYVQYNYKTQIKPLQRLYKEKTSELGEKRKKKSESLFVADFIWEYRTLPAKKIMELLADKHKIYRDMGEIDKIKSLERKNRK